MGACYCSVLAENLGMETSAARDCSQTGIIPVRDLWLRRASSIRLGRSDGVMAAREFAKHSCLWVTRDGISMEPISESRARLGHLVGRPCTVPVIFLWTLDIMRMLDLVWGRS